MRTEELTCSMRPARRPREHENRRGLALKCQQNHRADQQRDGGRGEGSSRIQTIRKGAIERFACGDLLSQSISSDDVA